MASILLNRPLMRGPAAEVADAARTSHEITWRNQDGFLSVMRPFRNRQIIAPATGRQTSARGNTAATKHSLLSLANPPIPPRPGHHMHPSQAAAAAMPPTPRPREAALTKTQSTIANAIQGKVPTEWCAARHAFGTAVPGGAS
jgi:hypothetical protein